MALTDLIWLACESGALAGAAAGLFWLLYARSHVSVPPNRALVLYGRQSARPSADTELYPSDITVRRPRIVVGGRAYVPPWDKGVGHLSLDPISVDVTVRSVQALEGSRASGWEVRLQAQAKIPAEPGFLAVAAENLLGKTEEEVRTLLRRTVEGATPAVLARLKSEDGEPDWDRLAAEIQASAAPDLVSLGLAVRTLSVTELRRIVPAAPTAVSSTKPVPVADPIGTREELGNFLRALGSRLARTERSLGILGAEVLRMARDSPNGNGGIQTASVLDLPLGWEGPVPSDGASPPIHDSIGSDRSPQARPSPLGDGADQRGRDRWPPLE